MTNYEQNLKLMSNTELTREYDSVESLAYFTIREKSKWRHLTEKCSKELIDRGIRVRN